MSSESTTGSKACCERPAAVASGYQPKGHYKTYADTKFYITGTSTAKKAIFFLYDVFGFTDQSLQGADILAANSGADGEYLVVMPDLFDGKPIKMEWFARDTEEKRQNVANFMKNISDPKRNVERVLSLTHALKLQFPHVERWGTIGYCWGGKLASLTSGTNTSWSAAVQTSPSNVDVEDAKKVTIPMMVLASKDEPSDVVKAYGETLTVPKHVETFETQIHGWMSARADLADANVKEEYERGYALALRWFDQHL